MTIEQAKNILKLDEIKNLADIRRAYLKMALQYHPDRYQTFSEQAWATKQFIKVKAAYDLLMSSSSIANENINDEDAISQARNSFNNSANKNEAEGNYEYYTKPRKLFDRIYDKYFEKNNTILGWICYLFLVIPEVVCFYYILWFIILSKIFEIIGFELKLGTNSTRKNRFVYLFIETLAASTFLPILYLMVLKQGGEISCSIPKIILGLFCSAMVLIFIFSEWISFFLTDIWRRSIQTDIDLILPTIRKS